MTRLLTLSLVCAVASVAQAQTLQPSAVLPSSQTYFAQRTASGTVTILEDDALRIGSLHRDADGVRFDEASRYPMPVRIAFSDVRDEWLFLMLLDGRFLVLDLADPAAPGVVADLASVPFDDFRLEGTRLYGRQPGARVGIYDATEPGDLQHVHTIDAFGATITFEVRGDFLYTLSDPTGIASRLSVYDISTPFAPVERDRIDSDEATGNALLLTGSTLLVGGFGFVAAVDVSDPYRLAVQDSVAVGTVVAVLSAGPDGRAFATSARDGLLYAVDISQPESMVASDGLDIGFNRYGAGTRSLTWHPELDAVSATSVGRGLDVIEASPTGLTTLGTVWNGGLATIASLDGDRLYLGGEGRALRVYDVSMASTPAFTGWIRMPYGTVDILARDGILYLSTIGADQSPGVLTWDFSDPAAPVRLGGGLPGVTGGTLSLRGDTLFSQTITRLDVVDVSNPASPVLLGSYATTSPSQRLNPAALDPRSGMYFVPDRTALLALDTTNPMQIAPVGQLAELPQSDSSVLDLDTDTFYLSRWGLHAVDVSDPTQPIKTGTIPAGSGARHLALGVRRSTGAHVYAVGTSDGLMELTPGGEVVGTFGVASSSARVHGDETGERDLVALLDASVYLFESGRLVASEDEPAGPALALRAAPNPTRGSVRLAVTLAVGADMEVSVYDALGRRVAGPMVRRLGPGAHQITLDTQAWAPGVYVARVQAGDAVAATRLTVVR